MIKDSSGMDAAIKRAIEMAKRNDALLKTMDKTREDWVEVLEESIKLLKPTPWAPPSDFYGPDELRAKGVTCGERSMIHKTTIIVNPEKLKLGDDIRIDGFCTISCGIWIDIGSNVHIAGYVSLFGGAGILIRHHASIASGAKVYSVSDDVMGRGLVGPCVPLEKRHLHSKCVNLGAHSVVCVNAVVMPGASLGYGSTLLPFSLLTGTSEKLAILSGVPAVKIKDRRQDFLKDVV